MKSFFKKIALVLTLALVVGLVPANTASAATTPGLKYSSKILYVGGDVSGKYSDWCWTPSENTTGYDVDYAVKSGKDLVAVSEKGKITATGEGVGKAVIEVTYTSQKTGASKTANFNVFVKQNATDVKLTNATQAAIKEALKVGDELTLKTAKTASNYKTGNYGLDNWTGVITDQMRIVSSDENVVKVDGFKLTAVGAGTATLTVESYQKEGNVVTATKDYPVVVLADGIVEIKQDTVTLLNAYTGVELEKVSATDFTIKKNSTGETIAIKSATLDSKNKKKVIIETYKALNDNSEYTLTYGEKDYAFKSTDNVVADIVISPLEIAFATATDISVKLVDANGVVLNTMKYGENTISALEFNINAGAEGYTNGSQLTLFEKGNKATATAIYHSYKYDEFGNELGAIKVERVIVAVDPAAVTVGDYVYTIAKDQPDFSKTVTTNSKLAVGDSNYKVYFYVKNSADTDVSAEYTLESSNPDVLLVYGQGVGSKGIYASVTAVAQSGSAYVIVRKNGTVVFSLPVAIIAERKTGSITLSTQNVTLSNSVAAADSKAVDVTRYDQYGEKMDALQVDVECLSAPSDAARIAAVADMVTAGVGKVDFDAVKADGTSVAKGTYLFRLKVDGQTRVVTVNVQEPTQNAPAVYKLLLSTTSVDTVFNGDVAGDKNVEIKVGIYKGGVLDSYADLSGYTVEVKKDGKTTPLTTTGDSVKFTALNVSGSAVEKAAAGTYTVELTYDNSKLTGGFVVSDSQAGLTVIRDHDSIDATSWRDMIKNAFTFYYGGNKMGVNDVEISAIETLPGQTLDDVPNKQSYFIKSVTLSVLVENSKVGNKTVDIKVDVNKTLIVK